MNKNCGFSLIELVMTIAVISIIASTAAPSFSEYMENTQLKGAAERVFSDMQLARSEAIKSNSDIHLSVNNGTSWCYGFATTANCDCSTNACKTSISKTNNIGLAANTAIQNGIHISPNGAIYDSSNIATSGQITFNGSNSKSIAININRLGQTSICSSTVPGYETCL